MASAVCEQHYYKLEREPVFVKKDKIIIMHKASHQGRSVGNRLIHFNGRTHLYTEDTGFTFEVEYKDQHLSVSTLCDGHGGYMTSYIVTDAIPELFPVCLELSFGDIRMALERLFKELATYINSIANIIGDSGTTCNVTVFDQTNDFVHVASLGDSPTLRYSKDYNGKYRLVWKSDDQDCGDREEIERMIKIHRDNGHENAVDSDVVYQTILKGKETGIWRNRWTGCMTHSSFGDLKNNYYTGMVNTKPRIYSNKWKSENASDIWIQCSDGLFDGLNHLSIGIQPSQQSRLEEIALHLDICHRSDNVASSLHKMQIDSLLKQKMDKHPLRPDSTRDWIESNIDNHLTKVFMF
jgi:serine/threonine protein phosphatase PrpC